MIFEYILVTLLIIFMASTILVWLLSMRYVNWELAKEKGLSTGLKVWGGYRHSWAKQFIIEKGKVVLPAIDKLRFYSSIAVVIGIVASIVFKYVINA